MNMDALNARVAYAAAAFCLRVCQIKNADVPDALVQAHEAAGQRVRSTQLESDLRAAFDLSPTEASVMWTLTALAIDPMARAFLRELRGSEGDPTIDCIRMIAYEDCERRLAYAELGASGKLLRYELIERTDGKGADQHLTRQTFSVARRILAWLHGDLSVDSSLRAMISSRHAVAAELQCAEAVKNALGCVHLDASCVVVTSGVEGLGRRSLLVAAAKAQGIDILEVDSKKLTKDHAQLKKQLKLIARECKLLKRAPLIRNIDALVDEKDQARVDLVGSELVPEIDGPVFVTCGLQRPAMRWDRPCVVIDVKPPTSAQRAKLWLDCLGEGTQDDAEFLATQYPLAPALIHAAAEAAKTRAAGRKIEPEDIYAGVRAVLDDRLGDFAKRVEVTQTWDDIVLPADQMQSIKYLIARIRQRRTVYEQWGFAAKVGKGLGTSALFSGPPGTGKTMVAGLIAKELGLELYQVDMAKVVSKWIGETERNLAALFDAAEAGHAILLFDEADSLFGKRTDVKSSNDRYANLETNYLLQRLESFTGICLLTSNHESAIDAAFMRRLSLHVRFELPDIDEREQLWRAMLPAAAPVAPNLDMTNLAQRFAMSGGYIRNAALRAAFMAADEGAAISARHLELAARFEYEGMGKIATG
jgi:SpoVK/Ycf46/Vps4 family AAA+-type ATPase